MGTFDSVYLNKIRLLEEENRKLKQILSEANEEGNRKPLHMMTSKEAFQLGADHRSKHGGVGTPDHYFNNRHFVAGFLSVGRRDTEKQDDVPDLK